MRRRSGDALAALVLVTLFGGTQHALAQPIDLLRGARTELAVSSAYRGGVSQPAALVDGDLETAWNSRTGDLVGAWIEVRLPENVSVTSIALTAGFTKRTGASDLFTGNHRITRVRVLRAGLEIGVYAVDPESRELQTLPVAGPGGAYRIEIVEVRPGTRPEWREVCVSELRIMGSAPGAQQGQRFPRVGLGQLPAPRLEAGALDRAQVGARLRDLVVRFGREWGELNGILGDRRRACALDEEEVRDTGALQARRQRFVSQVAELVESVDEVRADRLRASAFLLRGADDAFLDVDDHARIAAGFQAVVDWLGVDEERCRWASADATLRLRRAAYELGAINHGCEHLTMDYPPEGPAPPPETVRQCRVVERVLPRVEELTAVAGQLRARAARIGRYQPPEVSERFRKEWAALQAQLSVARQSCGWGAP